MKILVADDDRNLRRVLVQELSEGGGGIEEVGRAFPAMDMLERGEYDVMVLDLNLPDLSGMEVLKNIKALEIPVEVIVLTGFATVSTAVEAMKLGAYDYLTKPFKVEELKAVIEKAYEKRVLLRQNLVLKTQIKREFEQQKIITSSPLLLSVLENLGKIALSEFPILILGESGVGKDLVCRAIHEVSPRAGGPFIPINCAAIPENMLESELFGHEKGAFTGAHVRKLGLLEIADHGTLFLDEIGDLPPALQAKLLRVIETAKFFRVGGTREVAVDVKFVSSTNKDLKSEVEKGHFRQDLYFRISTLTVHIPPLRERKEDIPLLIEHFVQKNPLFRNKAFSKEAVKILSGYPWPGNVRELQNVVHRTLLLSAKSIIEPCDLPSDFLVHCQKPSLRLEDVEREHIFRVLKKVEGQRVKAAEILGMDPKTLYRKLLNYGEGKEKSSC